MKKPLFLLIVWVFPFTIFAQVEPVKAVHKINVSEMQIQTSVFSERNTYGTQADFKTLAPQSVILNNNMSGFSQYGGNSFTGNAMFSVMLGLQFSDKQKTAYKKNSLLRFGVSYFTGTNLTAGAYKEERKAFDTLSSTQTNQVVYIDSIINQNYSMNYVSEQLRFDGSFVYRTNPEERWSLYAGIGFTVGLSIHSYTDIYYSKTGRTEARFPNDNASSSGVYSSDFSSSMERFKNKTNVGASAYIPLGIDFRIGNKSTFWKRTHLFYELRPGLNITSISELRTITNTAVQNGLGIKVSW